MMVSKLTKGLNLIKAGKTVLEKVDSNEQQLQKTSKIHSAVAKKF